MLSTEKVRMVAALNKREKESAGGASPTDEEVIAAAEVYYALIDLANLFGLEMLSSWAVVRYQHFNGIAFYRGIQHSIQYWTSANKAKEYKDLPSTTETVSARWVLSELSGMKFTSPTGRDAYDFMKESMQIKGIKTP